MESAHTNPLKKPKVFWFRLDGHKGEAILFKYSPKYIYDLIIDGSGHTRQKWVSKVKSLRIVKAFSAFPLVRSKKKRNNITPFLLNLLQRQRNNLKDIRGVDSSIYKYFPGKSHYVLNTENLRSWKSFFWLINLKSLRIMLENDANSEVKLSQTELAKLPSQVQRFATHLKRLKKLKHVDLFVEKELSKVTSLIFSKLNRSQDILKMLTSLRIKMKALKATTMQTEDFPFLDIFQYATEFEFQDTHNVPPKYIIGYFGKFSNLVVLKLTLPFETYGSQSQISHVSLEYLQNIGGLAKLVELKISLFWFSTEYTSEFFRFFHVPASLQKFCLTIVNPKWLDILDVSQSQNWETLNPFEVSQALAPFYQKWENLKNFQSLNVRLENSDLLCVPNIAFIIPMLHRISYLKELSFETLVTSSLGVQKKPLAWCYFWETISHIRERIESLIIKEVAITLRNFTWQKQALSLKRLEIGKYVLGEQSIDLLVKALKKKEEREALKESLVIDQFVLQDDECLPKFLETFTKLPPNIKLTMSADLRYVSREALVRDLLTYIPKIWKNKGLDITFMNVSKAVSKDDLKRIKSTLITYPAFCYLEIVSRGGHTIYLFDRKYHSKEKPENLINESGHEFRTWIAEHDISDGSSQNGTEMEGIGEEGEEEEYEEEGEIESQESEEDIDFGGFDEIAESDFHDPVYQELDDIEKF